MGTEINATPGSGATPKGTETAPSPAPSPGTAPAQAPAQGQGQSQGDGNIRQLREAYDGLKSKHEAWEKLGVQPEQVGQFQGVYQKVFGEVSVLGRELGFPDEEIVDALAEDPIRTLDFLRTEAARVKQGQDSQAGGEQDLAKLVEQHVERAIGPIQERENVRATNEANALFERTVHQAAVESFKAEGIDVAQIPQDEMFMLVSATSEILKYDEGALRALKYEGKTAPIQKAFQEARTFLDKYFVARSGRERARGPMPLRPGAPAPTGKKPTLDELAERPELIDEAQGRTGTDRRYAS